MKACLLLFIAPAAFAQTSNTNCYSWSPNQMNCTTVQQPAFRPLPQVVQPDIVGNFFAARNAALQARQLELQNQLLQQQLNMLQQQRQDAEQAEIDRARSERAARFHQQQKEFVEKLAAEAKQAQEQRERTEARASDPVNDDRSPAERREQREQPSDG